MSEHKVIWGLLMIASVATALITWRYAPRDEVVPGGLERAVEQHGADKGKGPEPATIDLIARLVAERGTVTDAIRTLETMRLQPRRPRGSDHQGESALLVRVTDGQQWLDYVGGASGGREFGVSIALALEGGAPTKAVVQSGGGSRELPLAGRPKTANGNAPLFLLPQAGGDDYRFADFYGHPDLDRPGTVTRLRAALPAADPAFRAPMTKHLLSAIAAPIGPEESLGIAPLLTLVEERADILRAAGAREWLPPEDRWRLVAQWFGGQPVLRAAWAHAVCDPDPDDPGMDKGCWNAVLANDPALGDLLRAEVLGHEAALAPLATQHPIRLRLQRWRRLWQAN